MKKNFLLLVILIFASFVNAEVSKTVNLTTAGTLRLQLTANEMMTVTNLTVTGSIDARDFKFMRDGITNLTILDISGVTIQTYSGSAGTSYTTLYLANEIPNDAFIECSGLTNLVIPNSVTSIGSWAFGSCVKLTSLAIGDSVTSIGDYAFSNCNGLTGFTIPNSVITIGDKVFQSCTGLTNITISNSVTSIGSGAFSGCAGLTSLIIPNSVKSIRSNTFASCSGLTNLTIGNSVAFIESSAFYHCGRLSSLIIPDSVVTIGDCAFASCSGLTSVILSNSVKSLGYGAFEDCSKLANLTLGNSLTSIGNDAFRNCSSLTSLNLGNSVTSLGGYAFQDCKALTSITIPHSIVYFGQSVFTGCSEITSIYAYSTTPFELSSGFFTSVNIYVCTLYVPAGLKNDYQAAPIWGDFNIVEMAPSAIPELVSESINIYPNPVKDGFQINGLEESGKLTLIDLSGKVLLTKQVKTNDYVSVSSLPKGVYVVRLITTSGTIERKVLKK